jgi:hypothetical protein
VLGRHRLLWLERRARAQYAKAGGGMAWATLGPALSKGYSWQPRGCLRRRIAVVDLCRRRYCCCRLVRREIRSRHHQSWGRSWSRGRSACRSACCRTRRSPSSCRSSKRWRWRSRRGWCGTPAQTSPWRHACRRAPPAVGRSGCSGRCAVGTLK